jgi:hypothetical protein
MTILPLTRDRIPARPLPRQRPTPALPSYVVRALSSHEDLRPVLSKGQDPFRSVCSPHSVLQQNSGLADSFACQLPVGAHLGQERPVRKRVLKQPNRHLKSGMGASLSLSNTI